MRNRLLVTPLLIAMGMTGVGCTGDVRTTPDSVKVEAEVPKVEVKKTPDLDPRTDADVDIKTPTP